MKQKDAITGEKIPLTFLSKIVGTVIKDASGKKHYISSETQRKFGNDKQKILESLK